MSFGVSDRGAHGWILDEDTSRPLIRRAMEAEITTVDTADMYSDGTSQEFVGRALADLAQRGVSRAQIALAWVAQRSAVTAPIVGVTKATHIDYAVATADIALDAAEADALESPYTPREREGF